VSVRGPSDRTARAEPDQRWKGLARRFGDALRAADGRQAEAQAMAAHRAGLSIAEVHTRVITPAMYWIGELWERGAVTVADEHVATAISDRVMASLHASAVSHRLDARDTVLVAAPQDEHHGLGARMVADVLEWGGFRVICLGTNVPSEALAATLRGLPRSENPCANP
jgi:MerR family transcriptional regulator, light-induced transcriptional regulator